MHELATNAMKYGALSTDTGRVEVQWRSLPDGGFELNWVERGGPHVAQPTHRGFGSTLLERVTGRELGGTTRMEFRPDGVRVQFIAGSSALATTPPRVEPKAAQPDQVADIETHGGASEGHASDENIRSRRILIVEDSVLLGLELEAGLQEAGAEVIGMAADIDEAMKLIDRNFDVAVLDANLNGVSVAPVAEALAARGKPFIIATGYGDIGAPPEGHDVPVVRKPYNVHQIAAAVGVALATKRASG
jgi:CheY-like chemotaxis protein